MAKKKRKHGDWFTEAAWAECLARRDFHGLGHGMQCLVLDGEAGITDRKVQLFAVACARHVEHLFPDDLCRRALEEAEIAADVPGFGPAPLAIYPEAAAALDDYGPPPDYLPRPPLDPVTESAYELVVELTHPEQVGARVRYMGGQAARLAALAADDPDGNPEAGHQAALHRDIFGNLFGKAEFDPTWRTDTAISLARQMYESRDFGATPILADALQEAGCDNESVLAHCRDAKQVHARGCWVVDLVLGKT